jgi:hypothetical protein
VEDPKILGALRASPAGRFISDPLGPTAAIIEPGAADKVASALVRLGYLSDVDFSVAGPYTAPDADEGES